MERKPSSKTFIETSCGEISKVKGVWLFRPTDTSDENIIDMPYTDHWTIDTYAIRHNGKYGIYSLTGLGDFGNDGTLRWRSLDPEPFPYDEIRIQTIDGGFYTSIAYRKGRKWGINYLFHVPGKHCVDANRIVPCKYDSLEEAIRHLPRWKDPFEQKIVLPEEKKDLPQKNGEWDYAKINRMVMTHTQMQYENYGVLQEAIDYSIKHQYMVTQEENIDQPKVQESHTQYITSVRRTFEAASYYKGKKTAVLNFANNHSVGGAPFHAGAQEESLCRCSTLYPCLQAMKGPFYQKHCDDYDKGLINAMGNDDLIYTPDVVVFKKDERTDPIYPQMMNLSERFKVDVITCAAPELRRVRHYPTNYEEVITKRIKKILDVAAKEKVEVLILGAWGCGAFGNDIAVVSKAFYTLLERYDFESVEFALGSTKNFDFFPKGTKVLE